MAVGAFLCQPVRDLSKLLRLPRLQILICKHGIAADGNNVFSGPVTGEIFPERLFLHQTVQGHIIRLLLPVEIVFSGLPEDPRDPDPHRLSLRSLQIRKLDSLPYQQVGLHHAGLADHRLQTSVLGHPFSGIHFPRQHFRMLRQTGQKSQPQGNLAQIVPVHQRAGLLLCQAIIIYSLQRSDLQHPAELSHQLLRPHHGLAARVLFGDQHQTVHGRPPAFRGHIVPEFLPEHSVEGLAPIHGKAHRGGRQEKDPRKQA